MKTLVAKKGILFSVIALPLFFTSQLAIAKTKPKPPIEKFTSYWLAYSLSYFQSLDSIVTLFDGVQRAKTEFQRDLVRQNSRYKRIAPLALQEDKVVFQHKKGRVSFDFSKIRSGILAVNSREFRLQPNMFYAPVRDNLQRHLHGQVQDPAFIAFYSYLVIGLERASRRLAKSKTIDELILFKYASDLFRSKSVVKEFKWVKKMSSMVLTCRGPRLQSVSREHYVGDKKTTFFQKSIEYYAKTKNLLVKDKSGSCSTYIKTDGTVLQTYPNCPSKGQNYFKDENFYNFWHFAEKCCARASCAQRISKELSKLRSSF